VTLGITCFNMGTYARLAPSSLLGGWAVGVDGDLGKGIGVPL
jgi:hypothetical protein